MKILVFSDTHLTEHFDLEWFDYIAKLIKKADQVIINGDFWDGYLTTFDAFCNSEWQKLFPLLKKKQTVYVTGNHDKEEFMDERCNLFSDMRTLKHTFKCGRKSFTVQHGHLVSPAADHQYVLGNATFIRPFYRMFTYSYLSSPLFNTVVNYVYQDYTDLRQQFEIKEYVLKKYKKNSHFIFGHTHIYERDEDLNFFSCALTPRANNSYVLIEDGKVRSFTL